MPHALAVLFANEYFWKDVWLVAILSLYLYAVTFWGIKKVKD